jgi:protein-S-isoprenylcysteine O-methyltransferase Ste14
MTASTYIILALAWLTWVTPFFLATRDGKAKTLDRRARWGIALQGIAYSLLWQGRFWERSLESWRTSVSIGFFVGAIALSWTAARALGRHWRFDAAVDKGHQLVTWGPYRIVRHPIYLSMLCLLLGTGCTISPWPMLALSLAVFIVGTEIRTRIEDRLLAENFGVQFDVYRHEVRAYIPFVR